METALELDTDAAGYTRSEPVHFGSFPGVWEPGRPIAVSELGFASEEEALAAVADLELPLRQVRVDAGSAPMPERPNHLLSQEAQRVLDMELEPAPGESEPRPPRTNADADALAVEAGIGEWPEGVKTVAQKVEFLDRVRAGEVTVTGEPVVETEPELEEGEG